MGSTTVVIVLILSVVINGPRGHTFAAPVQDSESEQPATDPQVVHLIHYLTYLLDYIVRNYVPDWSLRTNANANKYFETALAEGRTDEPRQDNSKRPSKPDDVMAEKSIRVVEQLSHASKS